MADIKLNLKWDIDSYGDIEFFVSPQGSDKAMASFTLTEQEIAEELADDLRLFDEGEPDSILLDWENLSESFRYYADQIDNLIAEAKTKRGIRI